MNFLKFRRAKKFVGFGFSFVSAFAILKSDSITEKICEFLENQSKRHINNPLNSRELYEEKLYLKEIVN